MVASADAVLDALGDPTRRLILKKLQSGPLPVGVLAEQLPISRPAASQALRVLHDAELVTVSAAGTRRLYGIDPSGLQAVREYLEGFWSTALDGFARLAAAEARDVPAHDAAAQQGPAATTNAPRRTRRRTG